MTCLTSLHESAATVFESWGAPPEQVAEWREKEAAFDKACLSVLTASDAEWRHLMATVIGFQVSQGEAGGGSHQPNKQPARYSGGAA